LVILAGLLNISGKKKLVAVALDRWLFYYKFFIENSMADQSMVVLMSACKTGLTVCILKPIIYLISMRGQSSI